MEISNICNLQCSFCPEVERTKYKIEEDALRSRLAKIKPYAERVCFHVMGEPTGHPQFAKLVQVAEEMSVPLEITTNGTLLNAETTSALLNSTIVQVNFSLQSFTDNFPSSNPEAYLKKIFGFCHKAFEERPDLYINLRLWNLKKENADFERNDFLISRIEEEFSATINRTVDPGFRKSKRIVNRLYLHFDSRFEWPGLNQSERSTSGSCHGTRSHIAVLSEGTVVPCCLDKEARIVLGDLRHQRLEDVLVSERFNRIRSGFERGELVEDLCRRCDYAQRFSKKNYSAAT